MTSILTCTKNDRNDFERAHLELSISVSRGLLVLLVFDLDVVILPPPPPSMAKVAETATRAPVKITALVDDLRNTSQANNNNNIKNIFVFCR